MISIILPTYNEAENIIPLIKEITKMVKIKKEIIVVDDNSPDGTANIVGNYINKYGIKNVLVEMRVKNRGLTNSIQRGIDIARGNIIVWMDCDFSMPPSLINELLKKIDKGFDIAVGSRFVKGGAFKKQAEGMKDSLLAVFLSRLMNYSIQILLGRHFRDYTSGFVAVRKNVFRKIRLRGDYGEYFIDFIYKSFAYGFKIVEIPYICLPRRKGISKTGQNLLQYLRRGSKYMMMTMQLLTEKHILRTMP